MIFPTGNLNINPDNCPAVSFLLFSIKRRDRYEPPPPTSRPLFVSYIKQYLLAAAASSDLLMVRVHVRLLSNTNP